MTALRKRLIEDIQLRNFSPHTVEAYVRAVSQFSRHYGRSPDQLSGEQMRQYLLYLVKERQVSWSLYNQTRCALQFFYRVTLGRDEWFDKLPCAKRPKRLPTVLSPDELRRLFAVAASEPRHQALMMTLYGAGPADLRGAGVAAEYAKGDTRTYLGTLRGTPVLPASYREKQAPGNTSSPRWPCGCPYWPSRLPPNLPNGG